MRKLIRTCLMVSICSSLVSCGSPQEEFRKVIKRYSYIPFETPFPDTRVGTIVRGTAKEMYVVAKPRTCFPDLPGDAALRWVQPTDLPNQYKTVTFDFNADVNLVLGAGNSVVKLKTSAKGVKSVSVTFEGASVEFLDEMNFAAHYPRLSNECKTALAKNPFILQALHVTAMEFIFKDEFGASLKLDTNIIKEIVDIDIDVNWKIDQNFILKIESPKFIGYRLGKVNANGEISQTAAKAKSSGEWIFKKATSSQQQLTTSEVFAAPLLD